MALLLGGVTVWLCLSAPAWAQSPSTGPGQPLGWLGDFVSRHGLWVGLIAVFFGGLALNLTPCVYPMIPVTVAFFSGQAAGSLRRSLHLAFLYVIGMSLNYALLGLVAARTGALLGSWLQQPAVLLAVAASMVGLSLSMFGFYDLRLPSSITTRFGQASTGLWGAFVMGLVVGLVAAPCIGPFVLGLLLFVSRLANPAAGFLVFFVLGLGMGLPYVILGAAANHIGRLPKAGGWLIWSKKVLGIMLVGLALYFVGPLVSTRVLWIAVIGLLLASGVYLGWLERSSAGSRFRWVRRLVGSALVLSAVAIAWPRHAAGPAVPWVPYSDAAFEQARRDHRPILIDVYADWCLPCVEMDQVTFHDAKVIQTLASVSTLRVDATLDVSDETAAFLERYDVFGAPTILFFDRNGAERQDLRLLGFMPPGGFLQVLGQLLEEHAGTGGHRSEGG